MTFSRISKQILCALLSFSLAILPLRTAQALPLPVAIVWGAMSVAGVTFTAADLAGLSIAIAGSGAIAYFNMTSPDGSQIRVPASAASTSIIPAPGAAATAAGTPVVDWSASSPAAVADLLAAGSTPLANCQNYWTTACGGNFNSGSCAGLSYSIVSVSSTLQECRAVSTNYPSYQSNGVISYNAFNSGVDCPSGYTMVGSVCTLTNARMVSLDGNQDFQRNSSTPAIDPYSGDKVGTITGVQGTKTNSGDSLSFTGTAVCAGCSNSSDTFQGLVGGGTAITQQTQRTDASGASYVQSTTVTVAPDGTIAGSATQNMTGSLGTVAAADGSLPIIPAAAGAIPATPTMAGTSAPPLVLPTDYNREVTQTQIKDLLVTDGAPTGLLSDSISKVDTSKADMVSSKTDLQNIPTSEDPVKLDGNFFKSPFPDSAACSAWSFSFNDFMTHNSHEVNLDLCPHQDDIQSILGWVLYIITIATIFSMFIAT